MQEGLTQAQFDALPDWAAQRDLYDDAEAAALALCDAMTRHVHVPDAVFAAAKAALPARKVVELVVTIASYNCVSRVLEALEINNEDRLDSP